jgi:hypothetical protein
MSNNRIKLFAELVKADAWRSAFGPDGKSQLHVELSFQNGHFGGDSAAIPFTFSASLKRAILRVTVEAPLRINRASVARSIPQKEIELTKYLSIRKQLDASASAEAAVNPRAFAASLSGSIQGAISVDKGEEARVRETVPAILVKAQPGGAGAYQWELQPSYFPHLEGQPWHPMDEPRMQIESANARSTEDLAIRVFIECHRDDIDVYDLKLKNEGLQAKANNILFNDMNKKAAIQYIKICLEGAELDPGLMDNRFSRVTLADLIAEG